VRLAKYLLLADHVYLIGNGGSAANALHMANDFVSVGIKAHALSGEIASLTCQANDISYEQAFAELIKVFGTDRDFLIALSGSGSSPNIVRALAQAKLIGMRTWLLTGEFGDPSAAEPFCTKVLRWGATMQEAEERQIHLGHRASAWIREQQKRDS